MIRLKNLLICDASNRFIGNHLNITSWKSIISESPYPYKGLEVMVSLPHFSPMFYLYTP